MKVNIPSDVELADLIEHRDPASVTIYLPSSHRPTDSERIELSLWNAVGSALDQLKAAGADASTRTAISTACDALKSDREFWETQARSLALFVSPTGIQAFQAANELPEVVAVGDRFDVGPLLRSVSFPNEAFVLTVTRGAVHLYELQADQRATEIPLPELPDDLEEVLLEEPHGGQADRIRDTGALGPKTAQQRYCTLVQDAVLAAIGDAEKPMILCASDDLEPAYRAVNTYRGLLDDGIAQHPNSQSAEDLDQRAREILDALYARQLVEWKEQFNDLRGSGKAVSQLTEVARAATAGSVSELLFDLNATTLEGTIDDAGAITPADAPSTTTYGLIDELASRVLRSGGKVKAVRSEDLPDDSPVAAILRYPPVR